MFFEKRFFVFGFLTLLFFSGSFFVLERIIFADTDSVGTDGGASKILISEIKTGGEKSGDEFIELYNPNAYAVDLEGWSLKKKTKAGVTEYNLLSDAGMRVEPTTGLRDDSGAGLEIAPRGYFLIAPRYVCGIGEDEKCYIGEKAADNFYSVKGLFIANDNSIALYDGEKTLMDKVGWGAAGDFSGNTFSENIPAGKSLESRIVAGIMKDTGDNSRDFFLQNSPDPRNSKSAAQENGEDESDVDESAGEDLSGTDTSDYSSDKTGDSSSAMVSEAGKKIIINEILISPAGDDTKMEFIEIYNAGTGTADLGGWRLEDQSGKTGKYVFPAGVKIKSGEYQVFYSAETKLSLNNDGDGAVLKDATGSLIFKTPQSGEAKENISFALENNNWAWTSAPTPGGKNIIKAQETQEKQTQEAEVVENNTATQEAENVSGVEEDSSKEDIGSGENYDFSDGVSINEIFPDPLGRDNQEDNFEWVELFNENNRSVNLRGWCLDDVLKKGSKVFCFANDKVVAAKSYLVVSSSETKIAFNNSEEDVNLLWPDKRVVDSVSYQKAKEGFSYSLGAGGAWAWTEKATPAAANTKTSGSKQKVAASSSQNSSASSSADKEENSGEILGEVASVNEQYVIRTIAEAKTLPQGSLVRLSGLVSAPRDLLGENILYILEKDSGEGIQVFGTGDDLSTLLLGDEVKMFGRLSEVGGEKRLIVEKALVEKISGDNLLESFALDFADLKSSLGSLVTVEGEASSIVDNNTFLLKASGGEMKIYAEPETGISFANIGNGKRVAITGIFSRTSLGYRLLPRFKSDIRFLKSEDGGIIIKGEEVASKGGDFTLYLKYSILAVFLMVVLRWRFVGNEK